MRATAWGWGLVALIGLLGNVVAEGVTPKTWRTGGVDGWVSAERESVGVRSDGSLQLATGTTLVDDLSTFVVWDLIADGSDMLVATGDGGALYRIGANGDVEQEVVVIQPEITAIGRDGSGRILFGAAPDGVIYRLEDGEASPVVDTPESYIWRILPRDGGGTLIATGDAGKVYHLNRSDELELFVDLGAVHVTGLESHGDGFLATTESPGRLLGIDRDGKVTVLHDAAEDELRAPTASPDGSVFFLANRDSDPGRLYQLGSDGAVNLIWEAAEGFVYAMALDPAGSLWLTTGTETKSASLIELTPGSPVTWMEAATVTEPQILTLHPTGESRGWWIGTGGIGHLYRVTGDQAIEGVATSAVEDAGGPARWGALIVEPGAQDGASFETRSGNTRKPDETWSAWKSVKMGGDRGSVSSPGSRFLQWRILFGTEQARVDAVRVVYLPANRTPSVASISVSELGAGFQQLSDRGQAVSMFQELPGGVRVEFQTPARNGSENAADGDAAWARRYRTITWDAIDPNQDRLRATISIRGDGETAWKPLATDIESSPWVWDSATVPDGWYRIQVLVSDGADNPPGAGREASRMTEPFLVDNTPPMVSRLSVTNATLTGVAEDASSSIKKLEMAIDGQPWVQVFPEDGIPDMPQESIQTPLLNLESGDHVVVIRVFDLAGNPGSGRISFRAP